jgi:hypothetical protein
VAWKWTVFQCSEFRISLCFVFFFLCSQILWNVRVSHLPQINSEIKRSYTMDTCHKSLIRNIISLNSISWKYPFPSQTLINYIFWKLLFRDTTLAIYLFRKFLSRSTPVKNYTFRKSIPSDKTLPVAIISLSEEKHYQLHLP